MKRTVLLALLLEISSLPVATGQTNLIAVSELDSARSDWPKSVTTTTNVSVAIPAGEVVIPKGKVLPVVSVSNASVSIIYGQSTNQIPAAATDIVEQINTLRSHRLIVGRDQYDNYRVLGQNAVKVKLLHRTGIAYIPLAELPSALQKQLGYDPERMAQEAEAARAKAAAEQEAQAIRMRKEAEAEADEKRLTAKRLKNEGDGAFSQGKIEEGMNLYRQAVINVKRSEDLLPGKWALDPEMQPMLMQIQAKIQENNKMLEEGLLYFVKGRYAKADFVLPLKIVQTACATVLTKLFGERQDTWLRLFQEGSRLMDEAGRAGAGHIVTETSEQSSRALGVVGAYVLAARNLSNGNYDSLEVYPPTRLESAGLTSRVLVKVDFLQPSTKVGGTTCPEIGGIYYIIFDCTQHASGWDFTGAKLDREEHAPGTVW